MTDLGGGVLGLAGVIIGVAAAQFSDAMGWRRDRRDRRDERRQAAVFDLLDHASDVMLKAADTARMYDLADAHAGTMNVNFAPMDASFQSLARSVDRIRALHVAGLIEPAVDMYVVADETRQRVQAGARMDELEGYGTRMFEAKGRLLKAGHTAGILGS